MSGWHLLLFAIGFGLGLGLGGLFIAYGYPERKP
jgi:hypothetical protein